MSKEKEDTRADGEEKKQTNKHGYVVKLETIQFRQTRTKGVFRSAYGWSLHERFPNLQYLDCRERREIEIHE